MKSLEPPIKVEKLSKDEKPTGYLSIVHFASVRYGKDQNKIDLFIKSAPADQSTLDFVTENGMDLLELTFYREILPAMVKFEKSTSGRSELEKMFPKFYAGEAGNFYLILENVSSRGFKLPDCNTGLDTQTSVELMVKQVNNQCTILFISSLLIAGNISLHLHCSEFE